jgi:hypothetical protein
MKKRNFMVKQNEFEKNLGIRDLLERDTIEPLELSGHR